MKRIKFFFLAALFSMTLGIITAFSCEGSISSVNADGEGTRVSCFLEYQSGGECFYDCYCDTPDGAQCDRAMAAMGLIVLN